MKGLLPGLLGALAIAVLAGCAPRSIDLAGTGIQLLPAGAVVPRVSEATVDAKCMTPPNGNACGQAGLPNFTQLGLLSAPDWHIKGVLVWALEWQRVAATPGGVR